jgi:hypothetical protein
MSLVFPQFPRLPLELRIQIWRYAVVDNSRIVEVHWASENGFTLNSYAPAVLSACRESREHTRQLYGTTKIHRPDASQEGLNAQAAFNYAHDILYFPYPSPCLNSHGISIAHFLRRVSKEDSRKIRHLALSLPLQIPPQGVTTDLIDEMCNQFSHLQNIARQSSALQLDTLTLVFSDPIPMANGCGVGFGFGELPLDQKRLARLRRVCKSKLQAGVRRNLHGPPSQSSPPRNWGNPRIDVRTVERKIGRGHLVNWMPSG